jgi:hypothetical protein
MLAKAPWTPEKLGKPTTAVAAATSGTQATAGTPCRDPTAQHKQ